MAGATSYLPTQLRQQFGRSIAEHEAKLKAERERLTPRKKFGFKNRSKVGKDKAGSKVESAAVPPAAGADVSTAAAAPTGGDAAGVGAGVQPKVDTFQAPSCCAGYRERSGVTLVRAAGEGLAGDFALENLEECEVRLLSASTVLWIRGLKRCTVFAVPVKGSIYVTACEDCTLYLGSRQLRMHTSQRVDFYVHASSHPIIEHCSALRFAPYPTLPARMAANAFMAAGLQPEHNQWQLVDDFDWLKATHSPNWSVLCEEERRRPAALEELERAEKLAVDVQSRGGSLLLCLFRVVCHNRSVPHVSDGDAETE